MITHVLSQQNLKWCTHEAADLFDFWLICGVFMRGAENMCSLLKEALLRLKKQLGVVVLYFFFFSLMMCMYAKSVQCTVIKASKILFHDMLCCR